MSSSSVSASKRSGVNVRMVGRRPSGSRNSFPFHVGMTRSSSLRRGEEQPHARRGLGERETVELRSGQRDADEAGRDGFDPADLDPAKTRRFAPDPQGIRGRRWTAHRAQPSTSSARARMTAVSITERVAARVLVVDEHGALLLLQGCDPARPDAGTWWFTPGGGVDAGESRRGRGPAGAARGDRVGGRRSRPGRVPPYRALRLRRRALPPARVVLLRCARRGSRSTTPVGATSNAVRVLAHRWWTRDELLTTDETFFPEQLPQILGDLLEVQP